MIEDTHTSPRRRSTSGDDLRRRLTRVFPPPVSADERVSWNLGTKGLAIGRTSGDGKVCVDDPQASRQHAEIVHVSEREALVLRDLGSKNGTHLDGRRLAAAEPLADSAVIRVGSTLFVYEEVSLSSLVILPRDLPRELSLGRAVAEAHVDIGASSDLPILILGPTGVGKEVLARRVHARSKRSGPFVTLNCATLNRELIASELFGHVKGAFSGALSDRPGIFQSADRGTVFLDEIGELPLDQQPSLLRTLQEKTVRPIGSDREHAVDFRVVAATHQNLGMLEAQDRFRGDLLARFSAIVVQLPPLWKRRVEILPLFFEFMGDGAAPLTVEAAEDLLLYDWPKNVRELEHAALSIRLFARHASELGPELLPEPVRRVRRPRPESAAEDGVKPSRERLRALLEQHAGNVAQVAREAGVHRQQLYQWLAVHDLDPAEFRTPRAKRRRASNE